MVPYTSQSAGTRVMMVHLPAAADAPAASYLQNVEVAEVELIDEYYETTAEVLGDFPVIDRHVSQREHKSIGLSARCSKVARVTGKALKEKEEECEDFWALMRRKGAK